MAADGVWDDAAVPPNVNVAAGQAAVGQQIGYVGIQINTSVLHEDRSYQAADDSPSELFRIAKAYLEAGAFTEAAERIADVVARGSFSPEIGYYWALAILRGRPFDHLDTEDFEKLQRTFTSAKRHPHDGWNHALRVVEKFVECLVEQETQDGKLDADKFHRALAAFHELPSQRREEVNRHLGMMLPGAMQDLWDADLAEEIRARRMGEDRQRRVPLFFQPDPQPPRQFWPWPRHISGRQWTTVLVGTAAVTIGAAIAIRAAAAASVTAATLSMLLAFSGAAGAVRLGLPYQYLERRRAAKERELLGIGAPDILPGPMPAVPAPVRDTGFATEIDQLISRQFDTALPAHVDDPQAAAQFIAAHKTRLRREILRSYAPPVEANRLDWLIRWHARTAHRAWQTGTLHEFRAQLRAPRGTRAQFAAAAVAALLGIALELALATQTNWPAAGLATLLLLTPVRWTIRNGTAIYQECRRYTDDRAEFELRHQQETAAWRREVTRLKDRPDDGQMARWLDYDKDYVRTQAMKQYTLKNADVISHFILAEPVPGAQRARVVGGPPRYSAYRMRLFLLTSNGIRQVELHLDFTTGARNNERRTVFRYDAIASINTEPRTVRPHGRRQVATPEGGGPTNRSARPILRHALQITLLNGQHIDIRTNYDDLLPDEYREEAEALHQLAEDTTGANNALLILESVAADGRTWITREKERIQHKLAEYQRGY